MEQVLSSKVYAKIVIGQVLTVEKYSECRQRKRGLTVEEFSELCREDLDVDRLLDEQLKLKMADTEVGLPS